ncbi:HDL027Cp [Eremothecium sinecaudum]|uniref:HDL027Cp n=1 Tax=Eremothecium sinecaudum TaxID=45286 RepID=A0A109UZ32_9SACH|nr:HDL027Cp [Eremothecium sinecaudum]AMD20717.1 HDL027Cp [Eremothecium sinecaudum]
MTKAKILVLGANSESLQEILLKSAKLNAKSGPFDCSIILGSALKSLLFDPKEPVTGPTFVTNGGSNLSDKSGSHEICENIKLLNNYGVYQISCGLKIGYLTINDDGVANLKDEIMTVFSKASGVHILLTHYWPSVIRLGKSSLGREFIDEIVTTTKPFYHFSALGENFFELEPFKWYDSEDPIITRFINLGIYGTGEKWAYAFNITFDTDEKVIIPENIIDNPFLRAKRSLESPQSSSTKKPKVLLPSSCHFCLSNPNVADHMVISVSKLSYLTIAKGPLSIPRDEMEFSGHCLIIPIEHIPKLNHSNSKSDDILNTPLALDMSKFEESIVNMNYKNYDMCTVVFEINSSNSIHYHKQVIPVPKYFIANFVNALNRQVHLNNERFTSNAKFEFQEYTGIKNAEYLVLLNDPATNYLQFTVYETPKTDPKIYIATFEADERLDLQFGRRVLAFLLKLPRRVLWNSKICEQRKEDEEAEVEKFQIGYKTFDFTI